MPMPGPFRISLSGMLTDPGDKLRAIEEDEMLYETPKKAAETGFPGL